ncbi:MAG: cation diffusion facilitator family transporter [Gammaproteobacteria bacterium]|nr:cation diffusion facilitator family transporter [Gammaproteobacteria bacterium]
MQRLLWAMLLTLGFMVVEVFGGILSGSLALLADAGHMLTDTASLFIAWFAARQALRPADTLRSYGYHRMQILAAFINGIAFIAIVLWIVVEAVNRFMSPVQVHGKMMIIVAIMGLLVNLLAFRLLHGGDHHNLNMRAALLHVLGDLLGSVAAILAAGIIIATGWMPIDPLLSILVALLILRSAWQVVRQSGHILLEGTPEDLDAVLIRETLMQDVAAVRDVHHIHIWSLTPTFPLLTLHVNLEEGADYVQALQQIKQVLVKRFNIQHSTVQVELEHCIDHH